MTTTLLRVLSVTPIITVATCEFCTLLDQHWSQISKIIKYTTMNFCLGESNLGSNNCVELTAKVY